MLPAPDVRPGSGFFMLSLLTLVLSSFLLALLLTPLVRNASRRRGWVDRPDARRKLHLLAVPRTGGAAVLAAYLGAFAVLLLSGLQAGTMVDLHLAARLAPAVLIMFAVGLFDDLHGMTAWYKLGGQVTAACVAYAGGVQFQGIGGFPVPELLVLPATVFWLVMVTNAVNLIDGMDGLATGVALFATITILVAGFQGNNLPLAMAVAPLAGALLGFLRYNFNPATIFLGDSGSLTIGFLLGCFGIFWSQKSATILGVTAPLLALAIPLLDSALAVVRRFIRRQPIFGADRAHLHHKLLDKGLTVRQAALILYSVSLLFAILSLSSSLIHDSYAGVTLVLFGAMTWIGVQSLGYVEITMAGRLLIGGGFRRMIVGQLIIRQFAVDLRAARDGSGVWPVVREAARELGFDAVELTMDGESFAERFRRKAEKEEWTAEVALPGDTRVRLTRPFELSTHEAAMGPFLDTLRAELLRRVTMRNDTSGVRAAGA